MAFDRKAGTTASLTVGELVLLYDSHAAAYYVKNGKPTSEVTLINYALNTRVQHYVRMLVTDFRPLALKRLQKDMMGYGWIRKTINRNINRIRRLFVGLQRTASMCGDPDRANCSPRAPQGMHSGEAKEGTGVRPVAKIIGLLGLSPLLTR